MIKRDVVMPIELIREIAEIVHSENYSILQDAFPSADMEGPVFISQDEAEALIELAVIEKKKARLKYPYYDDEHPLYNEADEDNFDDIQMGIYEKTIYYVGSAFKNNNFQDLL